VFVDSRTLDDGTVIDAEVCIIGAGAAGITLALELADHIMILIEDLISLIIEEVKIVLSGVRSWFVYVFS
jgi:NADH dehydrogenase FAD-containing subunit